jgi:prepilin-type processing-associated H-X9-DG protein
LWAKNICNNNYLGSQGTTTVTWSSSNGIFSHTQTYGISDVTDGTSYTIAFAEALVGDESRPFQPIPYRASLTPSSNMLGNDPSLSASNAGYLDANTNPKNVIADLNTCSQNFVAGNPAVNSDQDKGFTWTSGEIGIGLFNTIVPPNSNQWKFSACRFGCVGCGADDGQYTQACSNHPGGCNAAMSDGSARFFKSSIAMPTWWALGTRNNGEAISADQY